LTPPIILVTAFGRTDLHAKAEAVGIRHALLKPVSPSQLFNCVLEAAQADSRITYPVRQEDGLPPLSRKLSGLKVLLVEDNLVNQQVAEEILSQEGIAVEVADNGQQALDTLRARPDDFHMVLMDLQMPVMDGYEATRRLRALPGFADLPIIAMTAHAMSGEREACVQAGMNDHVAKPIEVDKLFEVIQRWAPAHILEAAAAQKDAPAAGAGGQDIVPAAVAHAAENGRTVRAGAGRSDAGPPARVPRSIPGLDADSAIKRLGNNEALYLKTLRLFYEHLPEHREELAAAFRADDAEHLCRAAHTLKGLGATIGANDLAGQAANLEKSLEEGGSADMQALENLRKGLDDLEMRIRESGLFAEHGPEAETRLAVSPAEAEALMQNLCRLLRESDSRAPEFFNEQSAFFSSYLSTDEFEQVKRCLRFFDYDEVLDLLQAKVGNLPE
jgi:two-component system sensor histidine kinase/response regulator